MLGHPHFESLAQIQSAAPRVLQPDRVKRPGVKRLWKILAKQESGFSKQEEPAELPPAKGMSFHISGNHVARESVAGIVDSARNSRVGATQIRINLVVGRRKVELSVAPEGIAGKEHPLRAVG